MALQTQLKSRDSQLFHHWPTLDGAASEVKLGSQPRLNTPPPPTPEPTAPPSVISGTVAPIIDKDRQQESMDEANAAMSKGPAAGAAQAVKAAEASGGDPGLAAAEGVKTGVVKTVTKTPKMSTTLKCLLNLCAQYFLVMTLYKFVRTWNTANGVQTSNFEKIVKQATDTVVFAPMLCVLFIGTRMRALQLSHNHGAPPMWVQQSMEVCAYAVAVQTLLVLLVPMVLGEQETEEGDHQQKGGIGK